MQTDTTITARAMITRDRPHPIVSSMRSFITPSTFGLLCLLLLLPTSLLQPVAGQPPIGACFNSLDVYVLTDNFFPSPIADITQSGWPGVIPGYHITGPYAFNGLEGPWTSYIPKNMRRIVLRVNYNETNCANSDGSPYGPLTLTDGTNGQIIHSGELYTLPYTVTPTLNDVSPIYLFTTTQGSISLNFVTAGFRYITMVGTTAQPVTVVPGTPVQAQITMEGLTPTSSPMTFDLTVTGGAHIDKSQITFLAGSNHYSANFPYVIVSAPYTGIQAQTILLIGTRNYTVSPLNQQDDDYYGSSFVLPVEVIPNGVCQYDGGHLIFGGASGGAPIQWSNSGSSFAQTTTSCFWMKPDISNQITQIWLSFGPSGSDLEYGILGNPPDGGAPYGALFMFDQVYGNHNEATAPGYSTQNTGAGFNWHLWHHVCFINNNDVSAPFQHFFQIYVNGVPASAPTTVSTPWAPPNSNYLVTAGSRSDGTVPASGAFDDLYIWLHQLQPLEIFHGYQTQSWPTIYSPFWNFGFDGGDIGFFQPLPGSAYTQWSGADKICSSLAPQVGTLSGVSGPSCLQPLDYSRTIGLGVNTQQDGQLGIGVNGDINTGGCDWKGAIDIDLINNAFYICTWVNRYQLLTTQQTIFSIGSENHNGAGLLTVSYLHSMIVINFGTERTEGSGGYINIPLDWDSDGTYNSNDHQQWVHWCITVSPNNTDGAQFQPNAYFQLYRNGRWWYRGDLTATFQTTTPTPVLSTDNALCLGCRLYDADLNARYPLMGALDEFRINALPSFSGVTGGFDTIITTAFLTDSWWPWVFAGGGVAWFRFNDPVGPVITSTIWDVPNPTHTYNITLAPYTSSNYSPSFLTNPSSPAGFTCLTIGQPFYQNPTSPALGGVLPFQLGSQHPFTNGPAGTIDWVEAVPELQQALILTTHTQTFANHDFSICYWTRRVPTYNDASPKWVHYDVSIGDATLAMWIGSTVDSNTEYKLFGFGNNYLSVPAYGREDSFDTSHWVHICGTYVSIAQHGPGNAVRKIYRNGQLLGQDFPPADFTLSQPISIGMLSVYPSAGAFGAAGKHHYDEVMLFTSTISTSEIVAYFNNQVMPNTAPVFYWTFTASSLAAGGGTGFKSEVGSDIIRCTVAECGYKSWLTSNASDAANAPSIQMTVPMVCPLDYYSDGALLLSQRSYDLNFQTVTLETGAGGLLVTAPPTSSDGSAPFFGTDFGFSLWVRVTDQSPDPNAVYTIFEFGCANGTHQLYVDASSGYSLMYFAARGLLVTPWETNFGRPGVWTQVIGSYTWSWTAGGTVSIHTSATVSNQTYDSITNRQLFCSTDSLNLTIGSFFNSANFNGFIDEFKIYNAPVDTNTDDILFHFGLYGSISGYMARGDAIRQAQHLQLYLNFAEQQGQTIHSSHPITPSSNISWTIVHIASPLAEPQWYAPGITTYFDSRYETDSQPLFPSNGGPLPASEGSVPCTQVTLESPIKILDSDILLQYGGLPLGVTAEISFIWLQSIGPQGLVVSFEAPAGVIVTPNYVVYPAGRFNSFVPTKFNVTVTLPQYVTITFHFSGPEAVHLRQYLNRAPVLTFVAYPDITVDFACYFNYYDDATHATSTFGYTVHQSDVFHKGLQFYNVTQLGFNLCFFSIQRFNPALMESVYLILPDGSTLMSPPGNFSLWEPLFYVPLGTHSVSLVSSFSGSRSLTLERLLVNPIPITVTYSPATIIHGQVVTITVAVPNGLYNNITLTPILSDLSVAILPPSVTLFSHGSTAQFYLTVPITHPAISNVTLNFSASGLGADEVQLPAPLNLFNSYQLTGDALISATFSQTNGSQVVVPLLGTATPASGAYDVILPLSDAWTTVSLEFDQSLRELDYLFMEDSTNYTLPDQPGAFGAVSFISPVGTSLSFQINTQLHVGSHVLFIHPKSVDGSNEQLIAFQLIIQTPLISAQLICDSPDGSSNSIDTIQLDLNLTSIESIQLSNYHCQVSMVEISPSQSSIWVILDRANFLNIIGPGTVSPVSTSTFNLVNGVPLELDLGIANMQSYTFNLTYVYVSTGPAVLPPVVVNGTCVGSDDPCQYGSQCIPADTSSRNKTFTPTCACSPQFRGPLCQFAVLDCPDCVIPAAPTNRSAPPKWTNLTLVGLGFDRIDSMSVGSYQLFPEDFTQFQQVYRNHSLVQRALSAGTFDSSLYQLNQGFYLLQVTVDVGKVGNLTAQALQRNFKLQEAKRKNQQVHSTTMFISTTSSGHVPVTFDLVFSSAVSVSYPVLVYQSIYSTCLAAGEWKPDPNDGSQCLLCPTGGNCPGGGLVYPLPGYWSANEYTAPIACDLGVDQCPGTDPTALSTLDSTGHVDTQVCGAGYTGQACGSCASDYYQSSKQCFHCSSSASESAQLAGLLLLGLAVLGFLSLAVAIASSEFLATIVALFVLLQQTIATGKASSQTWPKSVKSLSDLFNTLGIINFDLTFLKPGCIAPTYSFIDTYYGTLLFAAIAFVMFQAACWLRKKWLLIQLARQIHARAEQSADAELYGHNDLRPTQTHEEKQKNAVAEAEERNRRHHEIELGYKRRIRHATYILGSLFYLKLTTLELNGLDCHQVPRSTTLDATSDASAVDPNDMIYVLMSDPTTQCWVGTHLITAVIIAFFLLVFSFGFPYYCMVQLTRAFAPIVLLNHSSSWIGKILLAMGYERIHTDGRPKSLDRAGSLDGSNQIKVNQANDVAEEKQLQKLHHVHMELFGYLFRGVKNERYFFRLLSFPISLGFTLTLVFVSDVVKRTFILGLLYSFNSIIHCFLIPFLLWRSNVISSGIQLASLVYTIGVLALMKGDHVNTFTMILGFVAIVAGIQYVLFIVLKRPKGANQVKKLPDDANFDRDAPISPNKSIAVGEDQGEVELIRSRPLSDSPPAYDQLDHTHSSGAKMFVRSNGGSRRASGETTNGPPLKMMDLEASPREVQPIEKESGVGGPMGGELPGQVVDTYSSAAPIKSKQQLPDAETNELESPSQLKTTTTTPPPATVPTTVTNATTPTSPKNTRVQRVDSDRE